MADGKKEEIRERIPLEELIREYNVVLQPAGAQRFKALCPFHPEKTPSFHVYTDSNTFHCFGCKAGGDVFTFVQNTERVSFPEALEILARRAGVILDGSGSGSAARRGEKAAIYEALEFAEGYYHDRLLVDPRAEPARKYLESRGLRRETWETFRLGYSLPEWDALLRGALAKGLDEATLGKAGLSREGRQGEHGSTRTYDYFRGRVMFPIADSQKRIVGFGARTLGDDQPKYLNTPKTAVFDKSSVLYGVPLARAAIDSEARVAIVEGYTDVLAAHQEGLRFFVASLGTAFTQENARRLRRLAPRVDIVFDGDLAGQSAAERSLGLLVSEQLDVRILSLTEGEDPFDSLMAAGGAKFRERLDEEAVGIFEFKWSRTVGSLDTEANRHGGTPAAGAGATARAFDEVLDLLLKVPDVIARKLYAKDFAERLGVSAEDVERRLREKTGQVNRRDVRRPKAVDGSGSTLGDRARSTAIRAFDAPSLEEVILETLLSEPDRVSSRWQDLPPGVFDTDHVSSELRSIARALERQVAEGDPDVERLVGFLDNQDAVPTLAALLARIEQEFSYGQTRPGWKLPSDTDETWTRCLKDLRRRERLRERQELVEVKARARAAGDTEALLTAERQLCALLREMARQNDGPAVKRL